MFRMTGGYSQDYAALSMALNMGDFASFKQQLDSIDDPDEIVINGYSLLNYSIVGKHKDFVEYLIGRGVDLEKESRELTPLMNATWHSAEILELLIDAGADVNRAIGQQTPLSVAIRGNRNEAIKLLESGGATIECRDGNDGPYVFYDTLNSTTIIITVDERNRLSVDTLVTMPEKLIIRTPKNDSFTVVLTEPVTEKESVYNNADKIFAMSDIEGNFGKFAATLMAHGIINEEYDWNFGQGHLVLLGDFLDRGRHVTPILWLIYKLENESVAAGGKVHYLLGNHELMNIWGDVRFVNLRYKILAYKSGMDIGNFYTKQSHFGAWLRTKNVIEQIGDIVFVHAGISDTVLQLDLSIPRINEIARQSIDVPYDDLSKEAQVVFFDFGVLWYRGYTADGETSNKTTLESVEKTLSYFNAKHIVIGHCIVRDISTDYKGKVIRIDVDHHHDNPFSGILITPDGIYKALQSGEKELILERN